VVNLTSTWYKIAFFELLDEHYSRAQAARQIAEQYAAKGDSKNQSHSHSALDAESLKTLDA